MKPQDRAARERKQKMFVVVGGVFLLVLMVIQLPRIMGGSSTAEGVDPSVSGAGTPLAGQPISSGVASPGRTTVRVVGDVTKLRSFSVFARKDPFVQQVATASTVASGGEAAKKEGSGGGKNEDVPAKKFATAPPAGTMTVVSVNGDRQTLTEGAKFPVADPMFVLIEEQPAAKSVVVGVVGGAYAGGAKTAKLRVGKPLVLVNTTTGARYRIVLVSVGSGEAPPPAPAPKP